MPEQFEFLVLNAPERLRQHGRGVFGVRLDSDRPSLASETECVIVAAAGRKRTKELLKLARAQPRRVLLEVSTPEQAAMAGELGFDGAVSKTPLASPVPLWGAGGIGLHTAAAWYAGGAAGVVLDVEDASWTSLAQRFRTLPAIVRGLRDSIREHVESAGKHARLEPLAEAKPDTRIIEGLDDAGIEELLAGGTARVAFSGINDARSAAMAAVLSAPLAEKGVQIGILAGAEIADEGARLIGELAVPFAGPRVETAPPLKPFDVAIVGMGCLLPKAPNVRAFWANILNKVDAIGDIPKERFNVDLYYDPDRKAKDKIHSRWGGFLDPVPFDPMRYGIPPTALPSIDPLQLLALVTVDQALRDAGYHDRDFPRQKTSVILGLSGGLGDVGLQYAVRSMLQQFISKPPAELLQELPEWTEDSFAGLLLNVAAGRVANRFDLGGVNFSVDAACASSLAAVYLAARELADHSSDMAIVGGVDTAQSPFGYLCFAKAQALSGRGRCRTFDESADGIAISEGISMMVLKRLEDAERDGDRIYAVIKGVAGSSDGKGRSMTAPRLEGQILALQRAYERAGIRPSTVGLIEAHGTGTALGDASELSAVADVFLADGATPQSVAIGSVKSMVGHTKSAAGITGLMKVALALYHKTLPATLHVQKPNPKLLEPGTPIFVNTETLPWIPPAATPRRGGVSAFGFGGTNFHAVLEEFRGDLRDPADVAQTEKWPAELYVWNDPTPADLDAPRGAGTRACRDSSQPSQTRLAIVATSPEDLRAKLTKAKAALESKQPLNDPQGVYLAFGPPRGKVAFLFPGQGSQKPHMLRELALIFPEFRASLEQAEESLAGRFPKKLSAYIYPPPAFSAEQEKQQNLELTDTVVAQPALGVVEIGLCRILARLGVRADMTAGHSYGEYVALAAAGVISDSALFELSESRGRAIKDTTHDEAGTMAAVSADADTIVKALAKDGDGMEGITLANHNSPRQTVISGSNAAVHTAIQKLEAAKLAARLIPVACAFHSPLMEPARERFAEVLARQTFAKPHAAVFSNTLGGQYPEDPKEIAALLASHLVRPVKFVDEIRAMYEQGARVFVEVGPKGVLTGLARQILDGKDARFIQIDSDRNGLVQFLQALAQLAIEGAPVDTAQLLRGRVSQPEPEARETGWLVNGLRAFPRNRPPQVVKPLDLVLRSAVPPPAPVVAQAAVPLPAPVPPSFPASGASDAVMLQFQQLMKQVLQTQTAIMTAYLQGAPAVPVSFPAAPQLPPVAVAAPVLQPPARVVTAPVVAAPPAELVVSAQRSFIEDLRRIAAERTGYPPEMLDLDAGIESDLGIDSIKRVEILTALQKLGTPAEQQSAQGIMNKLTGARTLREIADLIAAVSEPRPAVSEPPPSGSVTRDFIAELRAVAAERTGYPPEMLDLDAGIESDLGIDSIKRVEILTALQKLGTPEQQRQVQGVLNQLTSAKTLREIATILEQTAAQVPGPSVPAPSAPPVSAAPVSINRDFITELRAVAAERTGYPPEMLDLDAGIEADLGIDSIKRVEILTALQKLGTPQQQQSVQGIMNKLTSARTLREIADLIASSVGENTAAIAPHAPAPAMPAAAPVATGRDYLSELVKIASERTGYEPDMLDLDAGIEADLGIDSIKRVEILTALQQRSTPAEQAPIQAAMEKLTTARTLREIADRIAAAVGQPAQQSAAAAQVPRFILTTADKPRSQSKPKYYPGRICLITDDETGIASALADELKRNGERALLLRHSPDATIGAGDVFTTDLADPAHVESLIGTVRQQFGPIGAIIHLLPLRAGLPALQSSFAEWRELVRLDVRSLYALARATENDLKQTGRAGGALFAAITARGGAFGLQPNGPFSPTHFAVADFTKTLALEFTGVLCKVVDLDPTDPNPILRQKLVDELTSPDDTLQVGLPGDRRLTVVPQIAPLDGETIRHIQRDWVFLVTGGARGVTAEIARQLAEQYQPTLILAGASPLPCGPEPADTAGIAEMPRLKAALTARLRALSTTVKPAAVEAALQRLLKDREIVESIESLRRTGAKVEYHSVDVRNEEAFGQLIDGIYADHGRLDVVVHGAGIIEDKLIRDKTPESFDRVVHTKADAVFLLSRKLRPESLQCLLLMSSVTAAFGNRGQADYAAANGIMNGLSVLLSAQWPAHVVAMNWGPWGSSGMVSEEVRQQFLARGIQMVPLDGGAQAALREMEAGPQSDPVVAMGEGPWREIALPASTPRIPVHAFGSLK
jgi:acyl transferase domain-containing protein/NAD(P)-dependent dehydrogenase (short-subunit alcohol dehydrogenase family)/acyl carrier protein